jgi:hypothetical protein
MMQTKTLRTETKLLGFDVIKLENWKTIDDIISFVPSQPSYVYCELPATNLNDIHQLEKAGYQFSEFRIKSTLNTADSEYSTRAYYPFIAEIINEKTILTQAISLLSQNTCDDRFSNDPTIGQEFAMNRPVRRGGNIHNLKKSFRSWPTEFLLGIFNTHTPELIAFRSGKILNQYEAQLFQYAIQPTADFNHTADMLEAFTIQHLKEQGIQHIHAISTAFNIPELNRLTQHHGFKMVSSHVLLRKVF